MTTPRLLLAAALALAPIAVAAEPEPEVEMEIDRIATATPEQMREMADEGVQTIAGDEKDLEKLDQSTRGKAPGKSAEEGLDCVADSLGGVRQLKSEAEKAKDAMESALEANKLPRAASELRKIAVAAGSSNTLKGEAERCALGVTSTSGNSKTTASGGVGDPDDDTAPPGGDPLDFSTDGPTKSPL